MQNVIVDYKDLELLIELYEKHCKGNNIIFGIDYSGNLEVKLKNVIGEEIKVTVYKVRDGGSEAGLMATITKEDRLSNFLRKTK